MRNSRCFKTRITPLPFLLMLLTCQLASGQTQPVPEVISGTGVTSDAGVTGVVSIDAPVRPRPAPQVHFSVRVMDVDLAVAKHLLFDQRNDGWEEIGDDRPLSLAPDELEIAHSRLRRVRRKIADEFVARILEDDSTARVLGEPQMVAVAGVAVTFKLHSPQVPQWQGLETARLAAAEQDGRLSLTAMFEGTFAANAKDEKQPIEQRKKQRLEVGTILNSDQSAVVLMQDPTAKSLPSRGVVAIINAEMLNALPPATIAQVAATARPAPAIPAGWRVCTPMVPVLSLENGEERDLIGRVVDVFGIYEHGGSSRIGSALLLEIVRPEYSDGIPLAKLALPPEGLERLIDLESFSGSNDPGLRLIPITGPEGTLTNATGTNHQATPRRATNLARPLPVGRGSRTRTVPFTYRPLSPGMTITEQHIGVGPFATNEVPSDAVLDTQNLIGRTVRTEIPVGPIRESSLSPAVRNPHTLTSETPQRPIEITENRMSFLTMDWPATHVDCDSEFLEAEIIEAKAGQACRVALRASKQGVTSLVVYNDAGREEWFQVFVRGDARYLQHLISSRFPRATVEVSNIQEAAVLTGTVTGPETAAQIVEIAEQFYPQVLNHMRVAPPAAEWHDPVGPARSTGAIPAAPVDAVAAPQHGVTLVGPPRAAPWPTLPTANTGAAILPTQPSLVNHSEPAPANELRAILDEVRSLRSVIQELKTDVTELREALQHSQSDQEQTGADTRDAGIPSPEELKPGTEHVVLLRTGQRPVLKIQPGVGRILRVDGFDPVMLGVTPQSPTSLRLEPKSAGTSMLHVTLSDAGTTLRKPIVLKVVINPGDEFESSQPAIRAPEDSVRITVSESAQRILTEPSPVTRIAIADPKIADVVQFTPTQFAITGVSRGTTNVTIWLDNDPRPQIFEVRVVAAGSLPSSFRSLEISGPERRQGTDQDTQLAIPSDVSKQLSTEVSLHFENAELMDFLETVQKTSGLNMVVDVPALEEEGLTTDAPISIDVDGVSIKSALNLVLKPLHLGWTYRDEAVVVTSQLRLQGDLIAVAYPVATLLRSDENVEEGLKRLERIIMETVAADSWSEVGGRGMIHGNAATQSLVVRQTRDTHAQIASLLAQLQRLRPAARTATNPEATSWPQHVKQTRSLHEDLGRLIAKVMSFETVEVSIDRPEHIPFSQEAQRMTATVAVKTQPGNVITPAQRERIVLLVTGAVPGLQREDIAVLHNQRPVTNFDPRTSQSSIVNNPELVTSDPQLTSAPEANIEESTDDVLWQHIGLRLKSVPRDSFAEDGQYKGGVRVTEIRPQSPAALNGLRKGDVLVGIHVWETLSPDNAEYAVRHAVDKSLKSVRFYCLRDSQTLWGMLPVAR